MRVIHNDGLIQVRVGRCWVTWLYGRRPMRLIAWCGQRRLTPIGWYHRRPASPPQDGEGGSGQ